MTTTLVAYEGALYEVGLTDDRSVRFVYLLRGARNVVPQYLPESDPAYAAVAALAR